MWKGAGKLSCVHINVVTYGPPTHTHTQSQTVLVCMGTVHCSRRCVWVVWLLLGDKLTCRTPAWFVAMDMPGVCSPVWYTC